MYIEIFSYIDRIVSMVRPRKVLYMAIDGVAPRAKMNQQRSRRFRAAREEQLKYDAEQKLREEWTGQAGAEQEAPHDRFDSNCITPGTPFMERLATCLRYYVTDRLNNNPGWKNLKIIISDASVPGEGEHKVMDYIRRQRNQTTYDANTCHVLYGLDADLIMLALATHEPHFWILREDVFHKEGKQRGCFVCGQTGHMAAQCTGQKKEKVGKFDEKTKLEENPYVFLHVSILREYLDIELRVLDIPFAWDIERAMDDWVFMCFFVGNDFLPHLPSLEIREGAIDKLIEIWKRNLCTWGRYLTNSGEISLDLVKSLMSQLGSVEDEVFETRRDQEEQKRMNRLRRKKEQKMSKTQITNYQKLQLKRKLEAAPDYTKQLDLQSVTVKLDARAGELRANLEAAKKLKLQLSGSIGALAALGITKQDTVGKEKIVEEVAVSVAVVESGESADPVVESDTSPEDTTETEAVDSDEEAPHDDVRLWESGWKVRYYMNKFQVDIGDEEFRKKVVDSYIEGLCWVLRYYYQGVASWQWFYPFHYSPFASDFYLSEMSSVNFDLGSPFKPIEQLMGVLPAASRSHIPSVFHHLMTDDESAIIDFYPTDFPIDLNGKKHEWQGVALLPFINADRLLCAMRPIYEHLSKQETKRNNKGHEILLFEQHNALFDDLCLLYGREKIENVFPIAKLGCRNRSAQEPEAFWNSTA